jgi:hypothetical protein
MLEWLVADKGIEPHVPVWAKTERTDGTFAVSDFQWIEQANECRCPRGEALRSQWRAFSSPRGLRVTSADTVIYRATQDACAACPMKPRCCPNTSTRKIGRSLYEKSREVARHVANSPAYKRSRNDRKKVEVLFAHLKRILKLDRQRPPSGRASQGSAGVVRSQVNHTRSRRRSQVIDSASEAGRLTWVRFPSPAPLLRNPNAPGIAGQPRGTRARQS